MRTIKVFASKDLNSFVTTIDGLRTATDRVEIHNNNLVIIYTPTGDFRLYKLKAGEEIFIEGDNLEYYKTLDS